MLIGEYQHTLDTKKRLAIPSKMRKELGERAILTRGLNNCLSLYPLQRWQAITEKLEELPVGKGDARSFARIMFSGAAEAELDQLGRILIPEYLKSYAELKTKVTVVGVNDRLEIWDEERWNAYKLEAEKSTDVIAEKLGELGLY